MIEERRLFALRDSAALAREADRIRKLCELYVRDSERPASIPDG